MAELLQNYGPWLLFGGLMFFMMRKRGCCGGHGSHKSLDRDSHGNNGQEGQDRQLIKGGGTMSHCIGESEKSTTFDVEGMTCGHCQASVEKAVSTLTGVSDVEVSLNEKKVSITYNPDKVSEESLRLAIINQGYRVS